MRRIQSRIGRRGNSPQRTGNVPPEELEAARLDLDERTYNQEYLARFESLTGRVYYEFDRHLNVSADLIDTGAELLVGMDFNIAPMSAVIGIKAGSDQLHILDEIVIMNGNTELMCDAINQRYPNRRVLVYPDPSGRARKTSSVGQTDFSILAAHGFRVLSPPSAPLVVDRNNEVNAMFKNARGEAPICSPPMQDAYQVPGRADVQGGHFTAG